MSERGGPCEWRGIQSIRFRLRIVGILVATLGMDVLSDLLQAEELGRPPASVTLQFKPEYRGFVCFGSMFCGPITPPRRTTLAHEGLQPKEAAWITCATYSPDGRTLAVGDGPWRPVCEFPPNQTVNENGGLIHLVDTKTNRVIRILQPEKLPGHEYQVSHLQYSSDGESLLSTGDRITYVNGTMLRVSHLTAWNPHTGRVRFQVVSTNEGYRFVAVVSPDGRLAATSGKDGMVRVWDVEKGKNRVTLRVADGGVRDEDRVVGLAFSPDGGSLVAGAENGDLRFWETSAGRELGRLAGRVHGGHRFSANKLAFRPDGESLACRNDLFDATEQGIGHHSEIALYDPHQRRGTARIVAEQGLYFSSFAFSPDGSALAIGCASLIDQGEQRWGTIRLWNKTTQKSYELGRTKLRVPSRLRFSPDGKVLAVTDDSAVVLLEVATGRTLANLKDLGCLNPVDVAFSPDGRTLAATGWSLKLWKLRALGVSEGLSR
jgi:WD40 repeat protein